MEEVGHVQTAGECLVCLDDAVGGFSVDTVGIQSQLGAGDAERAFLRILAGGADGLPVLLQGRVMEAADCEAVHDEPDEGNQCLHDE